MRDPGAVYGACFTIGLRVRAQRVTEYLRERCSMNPWSLAQLKEEVIVAARCRDAAFERVKQHEVSHQMHSAAAGF
jgi:hypothetical protein